jgi:hypothetical protein
MMKVISALSGIFSPEISSCFSAYEFYFFENIIYGIVKNFYSPGEIF